MIIKDIIGTFVFIKDLTTGQIIRVPVNEFGNKPQLHAELEYKDNLYYCKTKTVNEDCVGGACPIK